MTAWININAHALAFAHASINLVWLPWPKGGKESGKKEGKSLPDSTTGWPSESDCVQEREGGKRGREKKRGGGMKHKLRKRWELEKSNLPPWVRALMPSAIVHRKHSHFPDSIGQSVRKNKVLPVSQTHRQPWVRGPRRLLGFFYL